MGGDKNFIFGEQQYFVGTASWSTK